MTHRFIKDLNEIMVKLDEAGQLIAAALVSAAIDELKSNGSDSSSDAADLDDCEE